MNRYPPDEAGVLCAGPVGKRRDVMQNSKNKNWQGPPAQGLYDPATEHDSCGVGFVVDIKGRKSHKIVENALTILKNLLHRGACGCEVNTGDGVGLLIQKPHKFFLRVCGEAGFSLPDAEYYGAGLVFLPRDPAQSAGMQAGL